MRMRQASSSSGAERDPPVEAGLAAVAPGERAAGPDAGRVEGERAEQLVDVVGPAGLARPRAHAVGRDEHVEQRGHRPVLAIGEPDGLGH